jgi:Fumarylacetoacetate (FAA) hydrolase family
MWRAIAYRMTCRKREFQLERGVQWTERKSCDTFNPTGPWLLTPETMKDGFSSLKNSCKGGSSSRIMTGKADITRKSSSKSRCCIGCSTSSAVVRSCAVFARLTDGQAVTSDEGEKIPGPESTGLSTVDRLAIFKAFDRGLNSAAGRSCLQPCRGAATPSYVASVTKRLFISPSADWAQQRIDFAVESRGSTRPSAGTGL